VGSFGLNSPIHSNSNISFSGNVEIGLPTEQPIGNTILMVDAFGFINIASGSRLLVKGIVPDSNDVSQTPDIVLMFAAGQIQGSFVSAVGQDRNGHCLRLGVTTSQNQVSISIEQQIPCGAAILGASLSLIAFVMLALVL
jgi:hypothetical protein